MIPLNLLLIAWMWFGRLFVGVGGWFLLVFMLTVVPAAVVMLLITTVLAYTQPGSPRALTVAQRNAQWAVWASMFGFGLFCPDFGDAPDSDLSLLTNVFGRSDALMSLSTTLTLGFLLAAVVTWAILLGLLTGGRRRTASVTASR